MRKMFSENQIKNIVNQGISDGEINVSSLSKLVFEATASSSAIELTATQKAFIEKHPLIYFYAWNDNAGDDISGIIFNGTLLSGVDGAPKSLVWDNINSEAATVNIYDAGSNFNLECSAFSDTTYQITLLAII